MPSSNYRDNILQQLLNQMTYPGGRGTDAQRLSSQDRKRASMASSLGEDAMLRAQLGGKRKRRAGEREGTFAGAYYPQLNAATDWAATGNMALAGGGSAPYWLKEQQDPELRDANERKRKQWAAYQKALLGMGGMR